MRPRAVDEHDFRLLWAGDVVSHVGTQITLFALPVLAVATLEVTGSQIGLLQALYTLPFLLVPIPAGVWIERRPLLTVLIAGQLVCAALVLSVPVADVLDRLGLVQLYTVAVLGGAAIIVCDIAKVSLIPRLVHADRLAAANSRIAIGLAVGLTAGPVLASALTALGGPSLALTVDGVTYLVGIALLARLHHRDRPTAEPDAGRRQVLAEVRAGLRTVFGSPSIRNIAVHTALFNGGVQVLSVAIVVYFVRDLGYGSAAFGVAMLCGGAGAVLGAVVAPALIRRLGHGTTLLATIGVTVNAFWVLPSAHGSAATVVVLCGLAMVVGLAGGGVAGVTSVTVRQLLTPKALHARMNASYQLVNLSTTPIAAIVSGYLVDGVGARDTLWIAAGVLAISVVPLTHRAVRSLGTVVEPVPARQG
ncbi:MFS transporter [Actinophytocola oryzae]|uniref:MFS transporter n=1 Tax=Actinophytocola oryzae TaxID=502181 RepID=UPI001414FD98|nr:MFS transporter [Actinophytocola oryzae]